MTMKDTISQITETSSTKSVKMTNSNGITSRGKNTDSSHEKSPQPKKSIMSPSASAQLTARLEETQIMLDQCDAMPKDGMSKLRLLIDKERKYMEQMASGQIAYNERFLETANVTNYRAILSACADHGSRVCKIMHRYSDESLDGNKTGVSVDLVLDEETVWVKVIARSWRGLHHELEAGTNKDNQLDVVDKGSLFLRVASANQRMFKTPSILFDFRAGLPSSAKRKLEEIGVETKGELVQVQELCFTSSEEESSSEDEGEIDDPPDELSRSVDSSENVSLENLLHVKYPHAGSINMDVTAMLAIVSNLTNGHANYEFRQKGLGVQADMERKEPAMPYIMEVIKDKRLVCCATAMSSFEQIVGTVGGPRERERATVLRRHVTVIDDQMTENVARLHDSDSVKERTKKIFGTGDFHHAVTLSANQHFYMSARQQNVILAARIHKSRVLSEDKESTANVIGVNRDIYEINDEMFQVID